MSEQELKEVSKWRVHLATGRFQDFDDGWYTFSNNNAIGLTVICVEVDGEDRNVHFHPDEWVKVELLNPVIENTRPQLDNLLERVRELRDWAEGEVTRLTECYQRYGDAYEGARTSAVKTVEAINEIFPELASGEQSGEQCECGCSHIKGYNDSGACKGFVKGMNGRCVYCDHAEGCHEKSGEQG